MKYQFNFLPHLGIVENPEFYINSVRDDIRNKICVIELCFIINDETCGIDIEYLYQDTWNDNDIMVYSMNHIEIYKITT